MAALDPMLVKVNSNTYFRVLVDPTIYDSDIRIACGLIITEPPAGSTVLDASQRQARRSNKVGRVLVSVARGKKSRRVPLIVDMEKLATIESDLRGKSLNLGILPVPWAIKRVSNG